MSAIEYAPLFDYVSLTNDGELNSGGTVEWFYEGSSVPAIAYGEDDQPLSQPYIIGSDGRVNFKLSTNHAYRIVIKDINGVPVVDKDGVKSGNALINGNLYLVGTTSGDTNPSYLEDKVQAGSNISVNVITTSANEYLEISVDQLEISDINNLQTELNVLSSATSGIAVNTSAIATNTSAIATNTSGVSTNASNIATNTSAIATNTSAIVTNTSGVSTNTSAINVNTSGVSTNASNIATNTSGINTNASNIVSNTSAINANASNISTNTSAINTNASNIVTNTSAINANTSAINANTIAIDSIVKGLDYQGTWNAATNTPTLVSSSGTEGHYYIVGVEGSTNLNGITDWNVGDWVIWSESASAWQQVDNTSFETVTNQGTGAEIFKQVLNGTEVQLRSLTDGSIISLTQNADDIEIDDSNVVSIDGTQTITGDKTFDAPLTSNAVFKSKGATIIEDSVFHVNKTSAPHIAFNNSAGTSAKGLVGEQSGSINLDSYNGLDVELNSDNDVRIGATGDVNVTGNEINLNAPTNVGSSLDVADKVTIKKAGDRSILLVGDETSTSTNNLTGFRVLARETEGDIYIDHKTKSGKLINYRCGEGAQAASSHTFMQVDPTDGDVTFPTNVNVGGDLTANSATLDGSLTLDTNQIVMNNLGSAHGRITSINSAYMDVTASGTGVDLRLESQSGDVNILASGTTNIDGATINGNLDVTNNLDVDGSITLEGSFQQSVDNTAFNVISRNSTNPALYVNNAHSGDIQVWQSDPTQTGQGIVARMHNDGSLDLSGVLNLASTTNASPSTGDIWRDSTYTTINDDLKVRSDKPILELLSTKNGSWTAGERKGAINFYGSDASGGGPNVHAFIQAQTRDTFGAATELSFGVSDSGSAAVESLRLKASGALNYRPITNSSPEDGDIWRDASDGKLKGREGSVTSNLIGGGGGGGVTPGSWTNASLATNVGVRSGMRPLRYRSDGIDGVQIEGSCKYNTGFFLAGGTSVTMFTLPSGMRPDNDINCDVQVGYNGSTSELKAWAHINSSTGVVTIKNGNGSAISELYDLSINLRFSLT